MTNYREVFNTIESTLRQQCRYFSRFEDFKTYENRSLTDADFFNIIIAIIFYSGFKAGTVTKKIDIIRTHFPDFQSVSLYDDEKIHEIMHDRDMIKNEKKIKACVANAKVFKIIVQKYGSFENYVSLFKPEESFENLMLFKEEIEYRFDFLGGITAYHLLTDIGLPVLKPDRVITRIFRRIGLIEDENQLLKTVIQGRKFSIETGYPIRYIDIIFVKYGQKGQDNDFGLDDGICLEKMPKCSICRIHNFCDYYADNYR